MKALAPVAIAAALAACGWVSFQRPLTNDELRLEREVRSYYTEVRAAFATGNPQALSGLFDPEITDPMTRPDIEKWAADFFGKHGRGSFKISAFDFDELGFQRAVVRFHYRVDTPDGQGGFSGYERDTLVKKNGRWYTARWEKAK
jgi:hypothetical protein